MADPWRGVREAIGRTRRMDSGRAAQAALEIYEGAYEDRAEAWRFLHGLASGDDALAGRDPVRIAAEQEVRRTSVRKEDARVRLRAVGAATWSLDRAWRFELALADAEGAVRTASREVAEAVAAQRAVTECLARAGLRGAWAAALGLRSAFRFRAVICDGLYQSDTSLLPV